MTDAQILEKYGILNKSMSLEQFLECQEEDIHAEWVDGKVIFMSPASRKHQEIAKFLTHLIDIYAQTHRLGVLLNAPFSMRLTTSPSVREPDLLFVQTQNLDRLKDTYLEGPADLVVEIVSPESIGRDRGDKFVEYESAGVPEYWLIDPVREQAEFYSLKNERYRPTPLPDNTFYSTVLPDFWLCLDWLWQDPLPNVLSVLKELDLL